jgi:hypothetical protein
VGRTDDRAELLRTQAVQACLSAMGAADVRVTGNEPWAGGVTLDSADTMTSRTYWRVGDVKREYRVRVCVEVSWDMVSE